VIEGLLVADKGTGVTSFQVVAQVRRLLRVPKVGHGGTLDPLATGVLPLLLGEATKLQPYLQAEDKEYVATVRLGVETDTLDVTGRVTAERPVPALDAADLLAALSGFRGEIDQVPPMYSALYVGGVRLHELARAGVEVERAPRRVRVDALEVLAWEPPRLTLRVACGKGFYVRSLAADLGRRLGCGGTIEALRRTRLGSFTEAEALPWEAIRDGRVDAIRAAVVSPERAVAGLPAVRVDEAGHQRLRAGGRLPPDPGVPALCRLYRGDTFLGVGEGGPAGLRAVRLLPAPPVPGPSLAGADPRPEPPAGARVG
jgi:tRNA pseudouridine55 synthase